MNTTIFSPEPITEKTGWMVFLAGPMKASPVGWRKKLVETATEMGLDNVTFVNPRYTTMRMPSNQAKWETQGLRMCDVALFWIPNMRANAELGNRVYAETTKMEFAENIARGKKIILGIDSEIQGSTRMRFLAKNYGLKAVHTSMEDCLKELKEWIESNDRAQAKVHYIAAPRFNSKEQLASHPEFVSLLTMNHTLMERWNKLVVPGDEVIVVGEFGDEEWKKLLNGDIKVVDSVEGDIVCKQLI